MKNYFKSSKKSGFTVLEMIIIIIILMVLLTITVVSISSARERGRDNYRLNSSQQIQLALEQYNRVCGEYPEELDLTARNGCTNESLEDFISPLPAEHAEWFYVAMGTNAETTCQYYHLGTIFEGQNFSPLDWDDDFDSTSLPSGFDYCAPGVSSNDAIDGRLNDGTDMYDVVVPFIEN